jgi:uncharacterized protein YjbJ (UPF0337 family)
MHQDALRGKEKQLRGEMNYQWSQLTPEDIRSFDGNRDNLVGLLESRYGFARRRAEREADWFLAQFEDKLRRAS